MRALWELKSGVNGLTEKVESRRWWLTEFCEDPRKLETRLLCFIEFCEGWRRLEKATAF